MGGRCRDSLAASSASGPTCGGGLEASLPAGLSAYGGWEPDEDGFGGEDEDELGRRSWPVRDHLPPRSAPGRLPPRRSRRSQGSKEASPGLPQ